MWQNWWVVVNLNTYYPTRFFCCSGFAREKKIKQLPLLGSRIIVVDCRVAHDDTVYFFVSCSSLWGNWVNGISRFVEKLSLKLFAVFLPGRAMPQHWKNETGIKAICSASTGSIANIKNEHRSEEDDTHAQGKGHSFFPLHHCNDVVGGQTSCRLRIPLNLFKIFLRITFCSLPFTWTLVCQIETQKRPILNQLYILVTRIKNGFLFRSPTGHNFHY